MTSNQAITALRDAQDPVRLFIACTGAGAGLQQKFWDVPGVSSLLAGAIFPYAMQEVDDFLGYKLERGYCSRETAIEMAMMSYVRAKQSIIVENVNRRAVGLGLTASVASSQIHRGDHRVFVAVVTDERAIVATVTLPKGAGEEIRKTDGEISDLIGLDAILAALNMPQVSIVYPDNGLDGADLKGDLIQWGSGAVPGLELVVSTVAEEELRGLFFKRPFFTASGTRLCSENVDTANTIFLPGSFNPIHTGHVGMAGTVEHHKGKDVVYLCTADSVHKPPLRVVDLLSRVARINLEKWSKTPRGILFTQGDPLFIDKAKRFPNMAFIVGIDTVERFLDPKWGPDPVAMLGEFEKLGTSFYVFGRRSEEGFLTIHDLNIPERFNSMFAHMSGRWDVSSTAIRQGR